MDQSTLYKMFSDTLAKMNSDELSQTLEKAKQLLSEKDYNSLLEMINKDKKDS